MTAMLAEAERRVESLRFRVDGQNIRRDLQMNLPVDPTDILNNDPRLAALPPKRTVRPVSASGRRHVPEKALGVEKSAEDDSGAAKTPKRVGRAAVASAASAVGSAAEAQAASEGILKLIGTVQVCEVAIGCGGGRSEINCVVRAWWMV